MIINSLLAEKGVTFMDIALPVIIMAALALAFGFLIVVVSKKFAVKGGKEDDIAPLCGGANCGGCGFAGCGGFAKALVEGKAELSACSSATKENKQKIAEILGEKYSEDEPQKIICACSGGTRAKNKGEFVSYADCAYDTGIYNGKKQCPFACVGDGTCKIKCPQGAISLDGELPVVDKSKCTVCGVCVVNCPRRLMRKIPASAKVYVACSSHAKGKEVMAACETGCIACGICAKNCPENAIEMKDGLPVIDYKKCSGCKTCAAKCPRKTIREC